MNDGSSAGELRFEMLGPIRAFRGAEAVDLGHPKQQAVLALLLLHAPRPVPLPQIVAALWNGDPPSNGVDVVQRYIGALRRALDPERSSLITLTDGGYVIRAGETSVDTGVFRATLARARAEHQTGAIGTATDEIRTALEMWRDEPLTGLRGPVFDSARARLESERAAASALLVEPAAPVSPATPSAAPSSVLPPTLIAGPPTAVSSPPAASALPPTLIAGPATMADSALPPTRIAGPPSGGGAPPPAAGRSPSAPAAGTASAAGSRSPAGKPPAPGTPQPEPDKSAYPEAVDPWEGHDLFPPDPLAMS
ncbi:AfsR/SARP family transcriptional regulator [Actinoplanes subglobosus]|uniref:BTAD domain-containing putative transcriptional regulator n=1 Tax=Actinoplanes subglobosus TaxID=1547892 RepID=A0ABV8J2Z9_9ACTN